MGYILFVFSIGHHEYDRQYLHTRDALLNGHLLISLFSTPCEVRVRGLPGIWGAGDVYRAQLLVSYACLLLLC
jgi:hypothetical protein